MTSRWCEFTEKNLSTLKSLKGDFVNDNSLLIKKARKEREEIIKIEKPQYKIENEKIPEKKLNQFIASYWVFNKVKEEINKLTQSYLITWTNGKLKNMMFIKCGSEKIQSIKERLPFMLQVMNHIQNKSKKQIPIELYLVLSNLKKQLDNSESIGPKHVNSGYTNTYDEYIFIWREEEFEKVSFHELMHLFDMDHRDENYIEQHNYDRSLYETITDFKAIFYNIIYISLCTKSSIVSLFNLELTFLFNQAALMIEQMLKNKKFISPVYAYFILKASLFNYMIKINESEFENHWNNIFINNINFNKIINKLDYTKLEKKYYNFDSARMSYFELI